MEILGIDEAGRGCVIGPMVVAGTVFNKDGLSQLRDLGVKDSKLLTSVQRLKLSKEIENQLEKKQLIIIPPHQIDKVSLNELDLQAITRLVNKFRPDKAIFDVPTHPLGVKNFVQAVDQRIKKGVELIGENKADKKYKVVSAASILAKIKRDQMISDLRREYGDFGSGYMSDSKTQRFLKKYYEKHKSFPKIVRQKWASVKRLLFQQQNLSPRSLR